MNHREFRRLFREFDAPSWTSWNNIEDCIFGVPPADPDFVRKLTGRSVLPSEPVSEFWAVKGRGAGGSRFTARLACYFGAGREYRRVAGERVYVGVFGPDRKQSSLTFRYIVGLLRSVPVLAALIVRETTDSIELSTGVVIEVITANTGAPRGRSYALVIVEEAAFLPVDEHGSESDRELLRAVRPALARVPGSLLAVISSPYWQRGELHRAYEERYGKDDPDALIVQGDTRTLNPSFSPREIERAYREDPVSAAAEYGAQFRSDVAEFFGVGLADCVATNIRERVPEAGRHVCFHFDGATGSGEDDAALCGAWQDDEGRSVQVVQRRWSPPFSPLSVVEEASAVLVRYGASEVQIDRFAPGVFADMFGARGISCTVAERDTSQMFLELLALVNSGRIVLLDDDVLMAQLRGLERRTRIGGRDSVGHRTRGHDDIAAACAGALVLAAGEDSDVPLCLIGGSMWQEWERMHRRDVVADTEATRQERAALWTVAEPWADAVEKGDDEIAAVCWVAVEAHVAEIEGRDADAGRRVRALLARVERTVAEVG